MSNTATSNDKRVEEGVFAPNHKPANLQEVEDDAVYIQNRRFRDQMDEMQRDREKAAQKKESK